MAERIEFESGVFSATGLTLLVDGVAQSHVDTADPTRLFFEYVQRIGHLLDAAAPPGAPIRVLHLGGGALTLPRYVAATRPGSRQVVVELDGELLALVLDRLALPPGSGIELRIADAADAVASPIEGGPFDVVVIDLYTRLDVPAFVETREFMASCLEHLGQRGILVANVADAAGLARLRGHVRALARAAPSAELLAVGDKSVLSGAAEGNAVLVAAPDGLPIGLEERLSALGPHPAAVLTADRLDVALWGAC